MNYTCPTGKSFNGMYGDVLESYCMENLEKTGLDWTYNSENEVPTCGGMYVTQNDSNAIFHNFSQI